MATRLEFWFRLLTPDTDAFGRIVCAISKSNTYHVETLIDDQFWTADADVNAVVRRPAIYRQNDVECYEKIVADASLFEQRELDYITRFLGDGYDYPGALNAGFGIPYHNPYKWFCSEFCAMVASEVGYDASPMPNPSRFRMEIKQALKLPIADASPVSVPLDDECRAWLQDAQGAGKIPPDLAEKILAEVP